jgi:hypothetical protein
MMKWFRTCSAFVGFCYLLLPQTPNLGIEIEGVQVRPGMTVSQVLLAFNGRKVARKDAQLIVTVPLKTKDEAGKEVELEQIRGTLYIDHEILVGACRPWNYSSTEDTEFARVLFGAVNGAASTQISQNAVVTTSVDRTPERTVEYLTIQIGQREIDVTRQENYTRNGEAVFVFMNECLWKAGYGPLVQVDATGKTLH